MSLEFSKALFSSFKSVFLFSRFETVKELNTCLYEVSFTSANAQCNGLSKRLKKKVEVFYQTVEVDGREEAAVDAVFVGGSTNYFSTHRVVTDQISSSIWNTYGNSY